MDNSRVAVTVYIDPTETVSVEKKTRVIKPNYFMIGNGTMNKIYGIDLLREMSMSSKAGQALILWIKDGIVFENGYSHIVKINRDELTDTQKQYLKTGYKELRARDLVRRTKKSHYMINPNALIPLDYEQAMIDWNNAE